MTQPLPEPTNVGPIAGGNLRASDADREQVATLLSTAYAEGRLSREEHDERVDQLMVAKTFDDLIPITRDLVVVRPGNDQQPVAAPPAPRWRPARPTIAGRSLLQPHALMSIQCPALTDPPGSSPSSAVSHAMAS